MNINDYQYLFSLVMLMQFHQEKLIKGTNNWLIAFLCVTSMLHATWDLM